MEMGLMIRMGIRVRIRTRLRMRRRRRIRVDKESFTTGVVPECTPPYRARNLYPYRYRRNQPMAVHCSALLAVMTIVTVPTVPSPFRVRISLSEAAIR